MSDPGAASPIDIGMVDDTPPGSDGTGDGARSRTRTILLVALLAVTLAGIGTLGYLGWQISRQKDAKLTTPPTIGALRLDDSADGTDTADYLRTALAAEVDLDETIGAVYRGDAGRNILLMGGTALIWTPGSHLDSAFSLVSDSQGAVTDLNDVDPGPLGGTMKCGTTRSDDGNLAVCGWSDHGSLAVALFPDRTPAEAAPQFREIRAATETRP